jgi:Ni,Fe-hydrogenase III component G
MPEEFSGFVVNTRKRLNSKVRARRIGHIMSDSKHDAIADAAEVLLVAVGAASTRARRGDRSASYILLLQRIRELQITMLELLVIAEPEVHESTRELAAALDRRIDQLQRHLDTGKGEL